MVGGSGKAAQPAKGTSDLAVRFVSAVGMIGAVVIALWLGGWFWIGFVILLAGLVLWEWHLSLKLCGNSLGQFMSVLLHLP